MCDFLAITSNVFSQCLDDPGNGKELLPQIAAFLSSQAAGAWKTTNQNITRKLRELLLLLLRVQQEIDV